MFPNNNHAVSQKRKNGVLFLKAPASTKKGASLWENSRSEHLSGVCLAFGAFAIFGL